MINVSYYCKKDCPDRSIFPNCHTYCDLYLNGKELTESIRQKKIEQQQLDIALNDGITRRLKRK